MSAMSDFKAFLQEYHDGVMDCEAKANAALSEGKSDVYTEFMKKKTEKMRDLYGIAEPYLKKTPWRTAGRVRTRPAPLLRFREQRAEA